MLKNAPMLTKALSAAGIAASGDFATQIWEHWRENSNQGILVDKFILDRRRQLAVMMDGIFITGPILHLAYELLEHLVPTEGGGALPAVLHVAADTFLLDPLFVCTFFLTTGLFERRPLWADTLPRLRREFPAALRGSWSVSAVCLPVQFASFRYVPVRYRVLLVNCIDLAWTATMSFFSHKESAEEGGGE
ncbi:unnamed protein product, partial [Heterosigma akashiwo]